MSKSKNPSYAKELDEIELIKWLKSHYSKIAFMNAHKNLKYEAHERTDRLHAAIRNLQEQKLSEQPEYVMEVWRFLFGKAIVYLKYRDTREMIHDDEDYGVETLYEFFKTFKEFQPLLYGASEARYRDHITHMLTVFLIGEYLIHESIKFNSIDVGVGNFPINIDNDEKEAMWCIIALTHDLGIPLEKIPDINKKIREMLTQFEILNIEEISYPLICLPVDELGIRLISSDICKVSTVEDNILSKEESTNGIDETHDQTTKLNQDVENERYLTHIQSKYLTKFSEAFVKRDHGILGCLVLLRNLVYFLETDFSIDAYKPMKVEDAKQFLIRRNILRTIASHNNDNIYYESVLDFSFLLLLFDEVHEWARPRFLSMIEQKGLTTYVTLKKLTPKNVHYLVEFKSEKDDVLDTKRIKTFQLEILQYFIRKCNKYLRVLRSAVKDTSKMRLTLEVLDSVTPTQKTYKYVHSNPQNVTMLVDSKRYTLKKLNDLAEHQKNDLAPLL